MINLSGHFFLWKTGSTNNQSFFRLSNNNLIKVVAKYIRIIVIEESKDLLIRDLEDYKALQDTVVCSRNLGLKW